MNVAEPLEFDHDDRRRVYEYVERHGAVSREELERGLDVDPAGVRHHVAILQRDGRLVERDGRLAVALDAGAEEEFTDGDLAFAVRPARQADLSGVVGVARQVAAEGSYTEAETVAGVLDHDGALLRHNEVESRMVFVATVEDEVVGWVHLEAPEVQKLAHTAKLTLGVLADYRGRGVGSHLLSRALEWAAAGGYEKVYQSTPATNEQAIAFLEDHGWETEAVRADHYRIDDEYVDEVMMARWLDGGRGDRE